MFAMIVCFFPIIESCSHFSSYLYSTRKTEQYTKFTFQRKNFPPCATIPNFLSKVAYYSPCSMYHLKSIKFTSGRQKIKKQPVLLNPLTPDFCIAKFTNCFSNGSSYGDWASAQFDPRSLWGARRLV